QKADDPAAAAAHGLVSRADRAFLLVRERQERLHPGFGQRKRSHGDRSDAPSVVHQPGKETTAVDFAVWRERGHSIASAKRLTLPIGPEDRRAAGRLD